MAIPVGIISAVKRRSLLDRTTMITSLAFISAPVFWLGLVALYLFAEDVGQCPDLPRDRQLQARPSTFSGKVESLLLPWIVLAAASAAIYARYLRSSMIDVMSEDYIRTARAKGLPERRVIMRHGVRSAITPIVTLLGPRHRRPARPATRSSPSRCSTSPGSARLTSTAIRPLRPAR